MGSQHTQSPTAEESNAQRIDKALLERRTVWGFRRVRNQALRTLEGDDYRKILEDNERWDRLVVQMNAYFKHSIELFPYKDAAKPETVRVRRPRRFYEIEREEIEQCFPGGRTSGEPGDSDLRDLLTGLQRSFTHNLSLYYVTKRVFEALVVGLFVSMFMMFRNGVSTLPWFACKLLSGAATCTNLHPAMNGITESIYIITIVFVLFIHFRINSSLHFCLESTLTESCLFVDREAALRTKNLTNLFDDLYPRIDRDRFDLEKSGQIKEWPERSKKWTILIYWLAKRLEYVERYVQIEIWVMRRWHYWLQLYARIGFFVIAVGFAAATVLTGCLTFAPAVLDHTKMGPLVPIAYAIAFLAGALTLYISYFRWNTPLALIEEKLQPVNWKRYRDVHLQEKFAEQIGRDQSEIIQKDDQLGGHKR
jgi:hypothetical protein